MNNGNNLLFTILTKLNGALLEAVRLWPNLDFFVPNRADPTMGVTIGSAGSGTSGIVPDSQTPPVSSQREQSKSVGKTPQFEV
jgi:hypothetical protein